MAVELIKRGLSGFADRFNHLSVEMSNKTRGEKALLHEVINQNVDSSKQLTRDVRYKVAKPLFEEIKKENGKPCPIGPDFIFLDWFSGNYGWDIVPLLVKDGLMEIQFDFKARGNMPLVDYLTQMAENDGWTK